METSLSAILVSVEPVLHNVAICTEEYIRREQINLEAVINIKGVFDTSYFEAIANGSVKHGAQTTICTWIRSKPKGRKIVKMLLRDNICYGV
jgi:hypothetical protein